MALSLETSLAAVFDTVSGQIVYITVDNTGAGNTAPKSYPVVLGIGQNPLPGGVLPLGSLILGNDGQLYKPDGSIFSPTGTRYLFQATVADGLVANIPLEANETLVKVSAYLVAGTTTLTPSYDGTPLTALACSTTRASQAYSQVLTAGHVLSLALSASAGTPSGLAISVVTTRKLLG